MNNPYDGAGWLLAALAALMVAVGLMVTSNAQAGGTHERPCGIGGSRGENRQMAACLARQPGIRVDRARALGIGNCESGFYARAHSGPYHGIYQLERDEFDTFQHQGPRWVDREFRDHDYGIYSARGNVLAAFAHSSRYGWGWIGVCD